MADHDKHEEEYRYPEEEYVQSKSEPLQYEEPESSTGGDAQHAGGGSGGGVMDRVGLLFKNRIVVAIFIVIVLFILFRIFMSHHSTTKKPTVAGTKPVPTVAQQPSSNQNQLTTQLAQQAASQSQTSSQIETTVHSLDNKVSSNASSINQIQSQLSSLQNSIDSIANNRSNVNEAISQLALEVKKMSAGINKRKAVAQKAAPAVPMAPPVTYYLRAVVPGRAWIYGTNKRSASITVGDRVKQYGRVLAINAQEGMVVTSSGKMIEFSSSDK